MNSFIDLCQLSAAPAPDGHSNFDNPTLLGPALIGVTAVTVAWGIIFTAARFYINIRKLKWADYFNFIALFTSIAILGVESTQLGVARHIWDVPACMFDANYVKGIYIPAVLLQIGSLFAKASIFLLFRQLFAIQKYMRVVIWIGLAFNFLLYSSGVAVATYYETPRAGEPWTAILDGRTLIPLRWWQAQSALSVVLDFYIFIIPLPVVAKLKLPIQRRIPLIAVFSLALMGIGASIASLIERIKITHTNDTTWISAILSLCSIVELNVAIIIGSAPGFSSFSRSHLANLSAVKLLISSFSISSKGKSYDSEAALSRSGTANVRDNNMQDHDHRYYELNDTWMLRSEATAD